MNLNTETEAILRDIRNWRLFSSISDEELKLILTPLEPVYRDASEGEMIVRRGERADRLCLVTKGRFAEQRVIGESGVHRFGQYKPGGFFGLAAMCSSPRTSPVEVTALEDGQLLTVRLDKVLADPRFTRRMLEAMNRELGDIAVRGLYRQDVFYGYTIREKLMTFFRAMRDKHDSDTFRVRMTQAELADYLNVDRANLSGELARMRQEGILSVGENRMYTVFKWDVKPRGGA